MALLLARYMDQNACDMTWDSFNRADYADQLDRQMIKQQLDTHHADLCGIQCRDWSQMDQPDMVRFVEIMRHRNPHKRIALGHYQLPTSMDLRTAFPDTAVVDVLYQPQDWWLAELMHISKTYGRAQLSLPLDIDSYLYADHIKAHFDAHGWVPDWMISSRDRHWSFDHWLADRPVIGAGLRRHISATTDVMIDAAQLLTDTSLAPFQQIMDHLGLGDITESDRASLQTWVEGNLRIIIDLGAQTLVHSRHDIARQKHELSRIISRNYDPVVAR